MTTELKTLQDRIESLESEVCELKQANTVTDEHGNEWTLDRLISEFGLTRRQAMGVFGLVAGGTGVLTALVQVTRADQQIDGTVYFEQLGDPDDPVQQLYVENQTNFTETEAFENLEANTITPYSDPAISFDGSHLTDIGSANIEVAEITDETLIVSDGLESDQTISAGSWEKLTGWEIDTDERGEFDSVDDEFSPDKDGYYFVSFRARFNGGGSEELRSFRLRNETDVGSVAFVFNSNTNPNYTKIFSEVVFLDSDDDYSFQVRNENSSDEIQAASTNTSFSVRSVFRGVEE